MKIKKLIIPLVLLLTPMTANAEEVVIPDDIVQISEQIGQQNNICPEVLQAMAWVESRCQEDAENGSCKGLMQVNVYTWKKLITALDIEDYYEPYHNMLIASEVLKVYQGDDEELWNALYEYNGGSAYYANTILDISEQLERRNGH